MVLDNLRIEGLLKYVFRYGNKRSFHIEILITLLLWGNRMLWQISLELRVTKPQIRGPEATWFLEIFWSTQPPHLLRSVQGQPTPPNHPPVA